MPRVKDSYYIRLDSIYVAVLDTSDYEDGRVINRINTPVKFRGKGYGSKLLSKVVKEADKYKTPLYLEILPSGGLSYQQLEAWYTRYGFKQIGVNFFKREPQ